jgi:hypothetical protein
VAVTVLRERGTLRASLAPFLEQNGIKLKQTFFGALAEHNGLRW